MARYMEIKSSDQVLSSPVTGLVQKEINGYYCSQKTKKKNFYAKSGDDVTVGALLPGLGGTLFHRKNATDFRGTVPPERLLSRPGQFRIGNSSQIYGTLRNPSQVFTNSSEIPKNNNGELLIFRRTPKSSVFRGCRDYPHLFFLGFAARVIV